MSGHIKKIDSIKSMAVYDDFQWSSSMRDAGNNIAEFKKLNIYMAATILAKQHSRGSSELLKLARYQTNIVHLSFNCHLMAAALPRRGH